MNKKILSAMLLIAMSNCAIAAEQDMPNALEILDEDYPGGSYDYQIEISKRINEIKQLEFTPEQSNTIKDIVLQQQRVQSTPYTNVPTPVTRSVHLKLTAGLTPPVIRLSANMLTTIVFTDALGNPWDISSVALNRNLFSDGADLSAKQGVQTTANAAVNPQSGEANTNTSDDLSPHNILTLEPLNPAAYGNIAITLDGLATPVIFILTTGQGETDMRIDARVSQINKAYKSNNASVNGASNYTNNPLAALDDSILRFADGTPPEDALKLHVNSSEIEAWIYNDELIVRTTSSIIYPAFNSSVTSTGGVTVYRFPVENQSITISDKNGQPKTIFLERL